MRTTDRRRGILWTVPGIYYILKYDLFPSKYDLLFTDPNGLQSNKVQIHIFLDTD